jgi:uncharacterized small protein (DUF1192 family)
VSLVSPEGDRGLPGVVTLGWWYVRCALQVFALISHRRFSCRLLPVEEYEERIRGIQKEITASKAEAQRVQEVRVSAVCRWVGLACRRTNVQDKHVRSRCVARGSYSSRRTRRTSSACKRPAQRE